MKLMSERGQAFSTFKLLIAAIVAVVILVILLSILGYIDFSPRNQPIVGAADALEEAYQTKSLLVTSQNVTFTRDNRTLTRLAIVERANIGIDSKQICLTRGDFQGASTGGFEGGVEDDEEVKIVYNGGGSRDVKFSVLCYQGSLLPGLLVGGGGEEIYDEIESSWVEPCECIRDGDLQKLTCCIIALKVAR